MSERAYTGEFDAKDSSGSSFYEKFRAHFVVGDVARFERLRQCAYARERALGGVADFVGAEVLAMMVENAYSWGVEHGFELNYREDLWAKL